MAFTACADFNPSESFYEESENFIAESENDAEWKEKILSSSAAAYGCKYGYSTHSDYWCCENYGYQCNTSSSSYYYSSSSSSYYDYYSSSSVSESEACYNGTSTYSDSWCCSNYGYRCQFSYITEEKTMKFSLTYYEQLKKMDNKSLNDGDPEISFTIYFITNSGLTSQEETGVILELEDQGLWSGTKSVLLSVPAFTDTVKVCPKLVEKDAFSDDYEYASNYCYLKAKVGYLKDREVVSQSDMMATYYNLAWEWYLY